VAVFAADEKKKSKGPEVENRGMKFVPAELTVKPGQTVVWTNNDDRDHTVTADDNKAFKSGNLKHGDTFEQKFTKPGKYPYACSYHPRMKGVVIVSDDKDGK
jgi:plastocyanin